ncbi:MAG TPA: peptide chain release factor 1 [Brevefilum fermentans]|jgi:peptide chain release factor 1|uniref:Peptide chain release factor 1 n=1 Tax=Candidatus Brevifilum fermentans TaxID=1986204 RepID=A0A1Y6K5C4_9CHLR|nr:peptide chain release factor 1 [Brevefilum fermentans]MDI9565938.1 peptide chain release factor 1 [Chloroflexota bacterium]OQB87283.1 MAG: Peptide chain release factor 1 [Chloroflexi bacterium ADurb.Bin120]SMX54843.1 peptide chain release factor RF-1 [Brevefilum fermentans]HOM66520.1 peptide chain release factor 1 [Brevefilum fermentans]HPX94990.1 peptide chain release factor 1 [Brevefilum fermentans]
MLEKLTGIIQRFEEIEAQLAQVGDDYAAAIELSKERADLEALVMLARDYRETLDRIEETRVLLDAEDEDLRNLAEMELEALGDRRDQLEIQLKSMLVPKDPRDQRNVIMEIRAGAGGNEAGLFGADLFRMYSRYAERQNWKIEILSLHETGIGGIKEVSFMIKGKGAFSRLKFESGVHRVQRVPETEAQGRIHTSTATVAVLAEVDDVEIEIADSDISIEVFKSAGAGGQNVQKNATAVRITHLPTGMVVACQDERSQLQNKTRAMSILKARLFEIEEQKKHAQEAATRRSQVGTGERSEKIRTYNYPQNRVTDHRINLSSYNLVGFLDGDIDEFIDELTLVDEAEKLAMVEE